MKFKEIIFSLNFDKLEKWLETKKLTNEQFNFALNFSLKNNKKKLLNLLLKYAHNYKIDDFIFSFLIETNKEEILKKLCKDKIYKEYSFLILKSIDKNLKFAKYFKEMITNNFELLLYNPEFLNLIEYTIKNRFVDINKIDARSFTDLFSYPKTLKSIIKYFDDKQIDLLLNNAIFQNNQPAISLLLEYQANKNKTDIKDKIKAKPKRR